MEFKCESIFGLAVRATHPGMWAVYIGQLEAPFGSDKSAAMMFCLGERLIHLRAQAKAA